MPTHYEELRVWQKGMEIVEAVYKLTKSFPEEERFGFSNEKSFDINPIEHCRRTWTSIFQKGF